MNQRDYYNITDKKLQIERGYIITRTYTDVGIMRGWGTWSNLKIEKDNKIKIKVPQNQVNKKTGLCKKSVKNILNKSVFTIEDAINLYKKGVVVTTL